MGSCDLFGLVCLSSGVRESSQPCTLQQEGEGPGQSTGQCRGELGTMYGDAEGCFCCAVQLLLVPSNITLLLRSISDVFLREQISVKDVDIVSLNSPAAAWSHSKHMCGGLS